MPGFKTNITIDKPIEVEGTVLPAGSYVLKLVDLQSERHLVRILNAEENRVIATVFTTPIYKFTPADKSEFNFYERKTGDRPRCTPGSTLAILMDSSSKRAEVT